MQIGFFQWKEEWRSSAILRFRGTHSRDQWGNAKPRRFKGAILKKRQLLQSGVRSRRGYASADFAASPLTLPCFISVEVHQTESMGEPIGDLVDFPPQSPRVMRGRRRRRTREAGMEIELQERARVRRKSKQTGRGSDPYPPKPREPKPSVNRESTLAIVNGPCSDGWRPCERGPTLSWMKPSLPLGLPNQT
jgi:hypothetical protein